MSTKIHLTKLILVAVGLFTIGSIAHAAQIIFPVAELGNCASQTECKAYCEQAGHMEACVAYGESHGLTSKDEAKQARSLAEKLKATGGPGGCTTAATCRAYCADATHYQECRAFVQKITGRTPSPLPSRPMMPSVKPLHPLAPSVRDCIKNILSEDAVRQIENGSVPVGINTNSIKKCFPAGSPSPRPLNPTTKTPAPTSKVTIPKEYNRGGATNLPQPVSQAEIIGKRSSLLGLLSKILNW